MSVQYWSALDILTQVAGELGLKRPSTITGLEDLQSVQLLSLLISGGNELSMYYPWAQFSKEWAFPTVIGQTNYDLPDDWSYFRDQTQWDRTDRWPLLGPKSPQEWAWLKGSMVAALPRQRFRVAENVFMIYPAPGNVVTLALEYISKNWVDKGADVYSDTITADGDILMYNPWLLIKFVKFKFYELKGFNTTGVQGDFMRIYNSLTGKDVGGKILSLSPTRTNPYLGPWSVPDGSWNVMGD